MRLLVKATLVSALLMAVSASAIDKEVQVDLLMSKVMTALKDHREAEALPAMEKLESMEPSLSKPLPEAFYYVYIETLYKAGKYEKALLRANTYMEKYGKKGKNYANVIEIMSQLEYKLVNIWIDDEENLMWENYDSDSTGHALWDVCQKECENRSFGGNKDWHLPSMDQLKKLYSKKENLKVYEGSYWSSEFNTDADGVDAAYGLNFSDGEIRYVVRLPENRFYFHFRCVRDYK